MSKAVNGKIGVSSIRGSAPPLWLWVFAIIAVGSFSLLVMYMERHQKVRPILADGIDLSGDTSAEKSAGNRLSGKDSKAQDTASKGNASNASSASGQTSTGKLPKRRDTQFDFYKLLPGLESVISEKDEQPDSDEQHKQESVLAPSVTPAPALTNSHKTPQATAHTTPQTTPHKIPHTTPQAAAHASPPESIQYFLQAGSFKELKAADRMQASLALLGIEASIHKVKIQSSGSWHRVRVGPFASIEEMRRVKGRLKANNIDSIMLKVKG